MNERIRKLAEQAGVNLSSFQFSGTPTKYEVAEQELEKFAELIIQQCAYIATNPYLNDEESYYGNEFAKAIKKHFGVEK